MKLINHIERIVQKTENSKLTSTTMKNILPNIRPLVDFLNCSKEQALLFAMVFYQTLENSEADLGDLGKHFEMPVMRMLKYKADIDYLVKTRLIRKQQNSGPLSKSNRSSYYVHSSVIDGILRESIVFNTGKLNSNFDFMIRVVEEMESSKDDGGGTEPLIEDFLEICHENRNLFIAQRLLGIDLPNYEKLILVFIAYKLMNGEDDIFVSDACEFLDTNKSLQLKVRRSLISGESKVMQRSFIESSPGMFRNESELNITDTGLQFLLGEEAAQFKINTDLSKTEIHPGSITPVPLFLNPSESNQMNVLEGIFEGKSFAAISERMKEKGMKAGFTVLLYGSPGTGKTESVYQLARKTGRNIFPVEISKTKSMWFGESEKMIKGVFDKYKRTLSGNKVSPILLFNEADGVFSTRSTKLDSPVSQTLNAIQNIILQEMEDFEGIMMATTNLTDNLDKAFDRRFLYKVKFDIPDLEIRRQIMQAKIPFLSPKAIGQLCEQFSLTGGQMANIAKKCNIHELLNGKLPESNEMEAFCKEELGLQQKGKLGF